MTTFNSKRLDAAAKGLRDSWWSGLENITPWTELDDESREEWTRHARAVLEAAGFTFLPDPTPPPCTNHQPVQHRDGKPPWCKLCGLTGAYTKPTERLTSASCTTDGDGCEPE